MFFKPHQDTSNDQVHPDAEIGADAKPISMSQINAVVDEEERSDIQWRLTYGHRRAQHLPHLSPATLGVILPHRERGDGTKYPLGLCGERIHRLARLFGVIDSHDGLTCQPVSKTAQTSEEAQAEFWQQRGRQFDPAAVDAALPRHASRTRMMSSTRGPCTPSTRLSSMSEVALGPLIQVIGCPRSALPRRCIAASGTLSIT